MFIKNKNKSFRTHHFVTSPIFTIFLLVSHFGVSENITHGTCTVSQNKLKSIYYLTMVPIFSLKLAHSKY